jgi:hypothetical protein
MAYKTNIKPPPRWRRQRKRWLIVLAVMGVFSAVGLLWLRSALDSAERRSAEKRESLIEAGVLEATPHSPSQASEKAPEERPREAVIELDGEMPELVEELLADYYWSKPIPWDALDAEVQAAIRRYLESQKVALEALHAARWRLYAPAVPPASLHLSQDESTLEKIIEKLKLLQLEALAALADGDSAGATTALTAALAEAKSVSASNLMWAAGAQDLCLKGVSTTFQHTVSSKTYTVEDLHALRDAFQAAYEPEQLSQSAGHFFRWGLALYRQPTDFADAMGGDGPLDHWVPGLSRLMLTTSDFSGWNTLDQPQYFEHMEHIIALTQRPSFERFYALQDFNEEMEAPYLSMVRFSYIVPQIFFNTSVTNHMIMQTNMVSAATAAAIEAYHVETGLLPENLEALAPEHMTQLPQDPFDGQSLRYQTNETGYTIYSVGWDGIDNGGEAVEYYWDDSEEGDQVFTVSHETPQKSVNLAEKAAAN